MILYILTYFPYPNFDIVTCTKTSHGVIDLSCHQLDQGHSSVPIQSTEVTATGK